MIKREEFSSEIRNVIETPIPPALIKQRQGGRTTVMYVTGNFIIDLLNRAFNYAWDWEITKSWIEKTEPQKRKDYQTQVETLVEQPPVAHVLGTLTVHLVREDGSTLDIKKSGFGSKSVIGGASDQESIFKAAATDAMKKAASLLGIGNQLWRDTSEQQYHEVIKNLESWTDELKKLHKEEIAFIQSFCEDPESKAAWDSYIPSITGNQFSTTDNLSPEQTTLVAKSLKAYVEQAQNVK